MKIISEKLNLKIRTIIPIGICSSVIVLGVAAAIISRFDSIQDVETINELNSVCKREAAVIENEIQKDIIATKSIAKRMENSASRNTFSREEFTNYIASTIEKSPSLDNIKFVFEPYTFDGLDSKFAAIIDKDKNAMPYVDFTEEASGFDYRKLKGTRNVVVNTQNSLEKSITVAIPINENNKTIGAIAADINPEYIIKDIVEERYFKTGGFSLENEENVIFRSYKEENLGNTLEGITKEGIIIINYPIALGDNDQSMSLLLEIEEANLRAETFNYSLFVIIVAILFCSSLFIIFALNIMYRVEKPLRKIVSEITSSKENLVRTSMKLNDYSLNLSDGSKDEAKRIEEISISTSDAIESLASAKEQIDNSLVLAEESDTKTKEGTEKLNAMIENVTEMKKLSEEIGNIIGVIENIAFQTNILALNASVEAARAGDAGKGFSTVAEEVKNLAQKSSNASKDTRRILEKNIELSDIGINVSSEVENALNSIKESVNIILDVARKSAEKSTEEISKIENIEVAVKEIESSVKDTSTNSQTSAKSSELILEKANSLNDITTKMVELMEGKGK